MTINTTLTDAKLPELQTLLSKPNYFKVPDATTRKRISELYVPAATDCAKCYTAYNATTQKYACYISLADGSNGGRSDSDSGSGLVEIGRASCGEGESISTLTTACAAGV